MQTSKTCTLKQLIWKICNNWYFLLSLPSNQWNRELRVKQSAILYHHPREAAQKHRGQHVSMHSILQITEMIYDTRGTRLKGRAPVTTQESVKYSKIIHFLVTRRRKKAGNSEAQSKEKTGEPTAYSSQDFKPIHGSPLQPVAVLTDEKLPLARKQLQALDWMYADKVLVKAKMSLLHICE